LSGDNNEGGGWNHQLSHTYGHRTFVRGNDQHLESCPPFLSIQLPCLLSIAGSRRSSQFQSTYFYLAKENQDGIKGNPS